MPHRPRPRPGHIVRADVSLIEDAQRRDQLATEIGAAASVIGERGERGDHRVIAHDLAEIALDPPEGHDKPRLDIEPPPDAVEQRSIFSQLGAGAIHALGRDDLFEILTERHRSFRLLAVEFDYVRQVLRVAQRDLYRRRPQALRRGVAADPRQECVEIALARSRRPHGKARRGQERSPKNKPTAHA